MGYNWDRSVTQLDRTHNFPPLNTNHLLIALKIQDKGKSQVWMAINKGNTAYTGTGGGVCGYFLGSLNIIRGASSLTGARVKKDPAFDGFRKSGNRMKEASPIAAALYCQIPKVQKHHSFYRFLTGEVFKMLKQGLDKSFVIEKLQQQYIDPILEEPLNKKLPTVSSDALYLGRFKGHRKLKIRRQPE